MESNNIPLILLLILIIATAFNASIWDKQLEAEIGKICRHTNGEMVRAKDSRFDTCEWK